MGIAAETAAAARAEFMQRALVQARRSLAAGGPPVGACLVRDGMVVAEAANAVIAELDITAHAEIRLLREACRQARTLDLSGCDLYVTVEPCLMCCAAGAYAGIASICFGAPLTAMAAVTGHETGPALVSAAGRQQLPALVGGVCADECTALIEEWARLRGAARG